MMPWRAARIDRPITEATAAAAGGGTALPIRSRHAPDHPGPLRWRLHGLTPRRWALSQPLVGIVGAVARR